MKTHKMNENDIVNHGSYRNKGIVNNVETNDDEEGDEKYIMSNKMIKEIRLLHRRHWSS